MLPIHSACVTPTAVAMTPPMVAPTGMVPHTMKRIVAFMRPCIRSGVMDWRSDTWLML